MEELQDISYLIALSLGRIETAQLQKISMTSPRYVNGKIETVSSHVSYFCFLMENTKGKSLKKFEEMLMELITQ